MRKPLHFSYYLVISFEGNEIAQNRFQNRKWYSILFYRRKTGGTRFLLLLDVNQKPI